MDFLNNIVFNKFREVSLLQKPGIKQDNPAKQQNNQSNFFKEPTKDTFEPSFTRLNDLDTEIINNNLVNFIPDTPLRLELQLGMQEQRLKDLKTEMKVLSFLGYGEESKEQAALKQKEELTSGKIAELRQEYRDLGLPYKLIDTFSVLVEKSKNKAADAGVLFTGHPLVKGIKGIIPSLKRDEVNQTLDVSQSLENGLFTKFSPKPLTFGTSNQNPIAFMAVEKVSKEVAKMVKSKGAGPKAAVDLFKNIYGKTVSGIKDFAGKLKNILPKKSQQENFFEASPDKSKDLTGL